MPPIIEKGNKNTIPKIIKIEFSDIKNNDSDFTKLILTRKFNRQEYITVNLVPIIIKKKKEINFFLLLSIFQ